MRWGWLVVALLLAAGWSWGWSRTAGFLEERIDALIEGNGEIAIACPNRRIEGFPFSMTLSCDSLSLAQSQRQEFSAGALQSGWRLLRPNAIATTLEGPFSASSNGQPLLTADWKELGARISFNLDGPSRVALAASDLSLRPEPQAGPVSAEIGALTLDAARRTSSADAPGARPATIRLSGEDVVLAGLTAAALEPFSLSADIDLDNAPAELGRRFDFVEWLRSNGLAGTFRQAEFSSGNGALSLSGPFNLARDGLLSARFDVLATDLKALTDFFAEFLGDDPERLQQIEQVTTVLAALGGRGGTRLTIDIDRGNARAGLLPLGRIGPLF